MRDQKLRDLSHAAWSLANSRLGNYIVPGLSSYLIGGPNHGKVRLFHAARDALDFVTPHSHRFDFTAYVLRGEVTNMIYAPQEAMHAGCSDLWCQSVIDQVCGADGLREYKHERDDGPTAWNVTHYSFAEGNVYKMAFNEIHSIRFSAGTEVLFFEGPQKVTFSRMLEPWVNGKCVPTFKTEDWMFERAIEGAIV